MAFMTVGGCSSDSSEASSSASIKSLCEKAVAAGCDDYKGKTVDDCVNELTNTFKPPTGCDAETNTFLACTADNFHPTCVDQGGSTTTADPNMQQKCQAEMKAVDTCATSGSGGASGGAGGNSNAGSGGSSNAGSGGSSNGQGAEQMRDELQTFCSAMVAAGCDDAKGRTVQECVDSGVHDKDFVKCPNQGEKMLQCINQHLSPKCVDDGSGSTKTDSGVDISAQCSSEAQAFEQCDGH